MGPVIADDARGRIEVLPGVESAKVEIVWDPPWNPHMISVEGRAKLGLEYKIPVNQKSAGEVVRC